MGGSGQSLKVRPRQGGPALWPCTVQVLPAPPVPPPSVSPERPKCLGRPWRVEAIRRFLTARTPWDSRLFCPSASLHPPKCTAHHPTHLCLESFYFKVTGPPSIRLHLLPCCAAATIHLPFHTEGLPDTVLVSYLQRRVTPHRHITSPQPLFLHDRFQSTSPTTTAQSVAQLLAFSPLADRLDDLNPNARVP